MKIDNLSTNEKRALEEFLAGGVPELKSESSTTETLEVTHETLVVAYRATNQSIAANTLTQVALDTEAYDELGEFDTAANEYVPQETGYYHVQAAVNFLGAADQDRYVAYVEDLTAGSHLLACQRANSGTSQYAVSMNGIIELQAGNSVGLMVKNADSSDSVDGGRTETYLHIRRASR